VSSVEDTLLQHKPVKTRKKKFKGRLAEVEDKVTSLEKEVAFLKEQLGVKAHSRVTPADMVEDWDQTLTGGLALGDSPLVSLPPRLKKRPTPPPPKCTAPPEPESVHARPDTFCDDGNVPFLLLDDTDIAIPVAQPLLEQSRFAGLDLDDDSSPVQASPSLRSHPRFLGLLDD
jgi:hypothetical protein